MINSQVQDCRKLKTTELMDDFVRRSALCCPSPEAKKRMLELRKQKS